MVQAKFSSREFSKRLDSIQDLQLNKYGIIEVVDLICTDSPSNYIIVGKRKSSSKPVLLIGQVIRDKIDSRLLIRNLDEIDANFEDQNYFFDYIGIAMDTYHEELMLYTFEMVEDLSKTPTAIKIKSKNYQLSDYEFEVKITPSSHFDANLILTALQNRTFFNNCDKNIDSNYTKIYTFNQRYMIMEESNQQITLKVDSLRLPLKGIYDLQDQTRMQGHVHKAEIYSDKMSKDEIFKNMEIQPRFEEKCRVTIYGVKLDKILFVDDFSLIGITTKKFSEFQHQTIFYLINTQSKKIIQQYTHKNKCKNFRVKHLSLFTYQIYTFCGGSNYSPNSQMLLCIQFKEYMFNLLKWKVESYFIKVDNEATSYTFNFDRNHVYFLEYRANQKYQTMYKYDLIFENNIPISAKDNNFSFFSKSQEKILFSKIENGVFYKFYKLNKGSTIGIMEIPLSSPTISQNYYELHLKSSDIQLSSMTCDYTQGIILSHCMAQGNGHKIIYFEIHQSFNDNTSLGGEEGKKGIGFSVHNVTYCDLPKGYKILNSQVKKGVILVNGLKVNEDGLSPTIMLYEPLISRYMRWEIDDSHLQNLKPGDKLVSSFEADESHFLELNIVYGVFYQSDKVEKQIFYIVRVQDLKLILKQTFNKTFLAEFTLDFGQNNQIIKLDEIFYPKKIKEDKIRPGNDLSTKLKLMITIIVLLGLILLSICILILVQIYKPRGFFSRRRSKKESDVGLAITRKNTLDLDLDILNEREMEEVEDSEYDEDEEYHEEDSYIGLGEDKEKDNICSISTLEKSKTGSG